MLLCPLCPQLFFWVMLTRNLISIQRPVVPMRCWHTLGWGQALTVSLVARCLMVMLWSTAIPSKGSRGHAPQLRQQAGADRGAGDAALPRVIEAGSLAGYRDWPIHLSMASLCLVTRCILGEQQRCRCMCPCCSVGHCWALPRPG